MKINSQYTRFFIAGIFFTIFGPSLFIILSLIIEIILASILSEMIIHSLRYKVYKYFVFNKKKSTPLTYISSIAPISLSNILIVISLKNILNPIYIAIINTFISATIGYLWSKYCFKYIQKSQ